MSSVNQTVIEFQYDGEMSEEQTKELYRNMQLLYASGLGDKYVPAMEIKQILEASSECDWCNRRCYLNSIFTAFITRCRTEQTWAYNNLDNVSENTTSAESRIRDTDMAEEMVNYSKNNILAQAGQSMLAQANQSNQGVLSLLQ